MSSSSKAKSGQVTRESSLQVGESPSTEVQSAALVPGCSQVVHEGAEKHKEALEDINKRMVGFPVGNIKSAHTQVESQIDPEQFNGFLDKLANSLGVHIDTALVALGELIRIGGANSGSRL